MSYALPETLPNLRTVLIDLGMDVAGFKTERQAAFMIQQLLGTRFKFPPKGQSCFPLLQRFEAAVTGDFPSEKPGSCRPQIEPSGNVARSVTGNISSKKTGSRRNPVSSPVIKSQVCTAVPPGLVIYADGACEPNPGIGGWGFVVYRDGVEVHADCGGSNPTTNNIMEMTGALMALRWFADRAIIEPVRLLCDSKYVVNGCNEWRHKWKRHGWRKTIRGKEIKNSDLWRDLDEALTLVPITLEWCKGHAGIIGNERADELTLIGRERALEAAEPAPQRLLREQLNYSEGALL